MQSHNQRHITYANGYRELGMYEDALEELEKIDRADRNDRSARLSRLAIYTDQEDWPLVASEAENLVLEFPEEVAYWLQWAYGSRRANSVAAARSILQRALSLFPEEPCILYNLGCYACVEGELGEALDKVGQAIELDAEYARLAKKDEDLKPLKEWLDAGDVPGS